MPEGVFRGRAGAKRRGNPYVELVHFITALADTERSDMAILLESAGVDRHRFDGDVLRATDALPHGAGSVEEFSDHIFRAIQEAWNFGSLEFGDDTVRSAYVLLGALQVPVLEGCCSRSALNSTRSTRRRWRGNWTICWCSRSNAPAHPMRPRPSPDARSRRQVGAGPVRDEPDRAGARQQMDPVVGRDAEIRQIVDILLRRKQNNPILTGEAGVGKTAVVEGFAQRLARGDVPPQLRNVDLHMLDIGLMQAGASVKGEFEKRLKSVIDEVQSSDVPIILFIDEAHAP